jgi:ubiquinone/menaquinone biosynthesis C-methylase UbiE
VKADAARRRTRESFARQAGSFERRGYLFRSEEILDWIAGAVPVGPEDRVLDVAGGTGAVGRHLSRRAAGAVILDLVPEMLSAGAAAAAAEGRRDVLFVCGDATQMPFAGHQFDVVVTRFALHHIDDPATAVREMARVCRPGGRVAAVDMVAAPGEVGDRHNELERLRDPSHVTALRHDELAGILEAAGIRIDGGSELEYVMPVARWLDQTQPATRARRTVADALLTEAGGGAPTGLRAGFEHDELTIRQTWALLTGTTPG